MKAPRGRPALRGRHWAALWLLVFLAVALVIVRRQGAALAAARELQSLQRTRATLEGTQADLQARINRARSRSVLVPLAERRLGLRLPQDSEITILQDPNPR